MNNQKMLDVVTMIANIILPDKCDHESALDIWLRSMKRKAREALESCECEAVTDCTRLGNAAAMNACKGNISAAMGYASAAMYAICWRISVSERRPEDGDE